jgi:PHD/YefM family antitoxin component YafN of YafNO toxin-antitoxin module
MWVRMGERRTISTARQELFELFDRVTGDEGERIVIARRTSRKEAVLISKDYLEQLETANHQLARRAATSFSLFGSATLAVPPDDIFHVTRQEQTRLGARKERPASTARGRHG